jgi:hypothetical protein
MNHLHKHLFLTCPFWCGFYQSVTSNTYFYVIPCLSVHYHTVTNNTGKSFILCRVSITYKVKRISCVVTYRHTHIRVYLLKFHIQTHIQPFFLIPSIPLCYDDYFYWYDRQTQQFVKPDYRLSLCKFLWTTCFGHSYNHHQVRKS